MLSAADLLLYEYEDTVLLSNHIFAVTNQGLVSYGTHPTVYSLSPSLFVLNFSFYKFQIQIQSSPSHVEITLSIKLLRACIVKKQISSLARVHAAVAPQGLAQELHFPLGALGTELRCLTTPAFESITCGPDRWLMSTTQPSSCRRCWASKCRGLQDSRPKVYQCIGGVG